MTKTTSSFACRWPWAPTDCAGRRGGRFNVMTGRTQKHVIETKKTVERPSEKACLWGVHKVLVPVTYPCETLLCESQCIE